MKWKWLKILVIGTLRLLSHSHFIVLHSSKNMMYFAFWLYNFWSHFQIWLIFWCQIFRVTKSLTIRMIFDFKASKTKVHKGKSKVGLVRSWKWFKNLLMLKNLKMKSIPRYKVNFGTKVLHMTYAYLL